MKYKDRDPLQKGAMPLRSWEDKNLSLQNVSYLKLISQISLKHLIVLLAHNMPHDRWCEIAGAIWNNWKC